VIAPETYRRAPPVQLLPSAESALALVRGEPGALWSVLAHTLARAVIMAPAGIAAGAVIGVTAGRSVAIVAAAAVAIEVGVIALAVRQAKDDTAPAKKVPPVGVAANTESIRERLEQAKKEAQGEPATVRPWYLGPAEA
jgi:hypothetical protein